MSGAENPLAFPCDTYRGGQTGMTLRDWFAGQALPAILELVFESDVDAASIRPFAAERSYEVADAMLAERAKGGVS